MMDADNTIVHVVKRIRAWSTYVCDPVWVDRDNRMVIYKQKDPGDYSIGVEQTLYVDCSTGFTTVYACDVSFSGERSNYREEVLHPDVALAKLQAIMASYEKRAMGRARKEALDSLVTNLAKELIADVLERYVPPPPPVLDMTNDD